MIHVVRPLAAQTQIATMEYVHVYRNIMEIRTRAVDPNVFSIRIVPETELAYEISVPILVPALVDKMHFVTF